MQKARQPTPVLLPGKSHGRRTLVGCSPWGRWGSDTTERLHFHFSLSCFGEGNGNPLQCSCLENPRDRGAWWAAVYGVTQGQTWLKWLSSSSSVYMGLPWLLSTKNPPAVQVTQEMEFSPWARKIPWKRAWQPIPIFLSGEFHGQRSLVGYSLWGCRVRHYQATNTHPSYWSPQWSLKGYAHQWIVTVPRILRL